jgi:hypothetical protein
MMKFQNRRQRTNLYKTSVNHTEDKTSCGSMVTRNRSTLLNVYCIKTIIAAQNYRWRSTHYAEVTVHGQYSKFCVTGMEIKTSCKCLDICTASTQSLC